MEKFDPNRPLTRRGFCYVENISLTKYYDLRKKGLEPEEENIDGVIRITPMARSAWHKRMAELARSEAAQIEAERRHAQAAEAGKIAAASPLHISKRPARRRAR